MTTTDRPALADLADPAALPDPYPVLAGLLQASPFAVAGGALVVVGRYEDCSRILRDPRASSERNRSLLAPPEMRAQRAPSFLSLDPPHFCLGAPLARLEATIALRAFAARVADPELDPAALACKPNLNLRGPERLVVNFHRIHPR